MLSLSLYLVHLPASLGAGVAAAFLINRFSLFSLFHFFVNYAAVDGIEGITSGILMPLTCVNSRRRRQERERRDGDWT